MGADIELNCPEAAIELRSGIGQTTLHDVGESVDIRTRYGAVTVARLRGVGNIRSDEGTIVVGQEVDPKQLTLQSRLGNNIILFTRSEALERIAILASQGQAFHEGKPLPSRRPPSRVSRLARWTAARGRPGRNGTGRPRRK